MSSEKAQYISYGAPRSYNPPPPPPRPNYNTPQNNYTPNYNTNSRYQGKISGSSTYADTDKTIGIILCFFFPFIAVGLKRGVGVQFCINFALWILFFFVPGFIHGLYIVLKD